MAWQQKKRGELTSSPLLPIEVTDQVHLSVLSNFDFHPEMSNLRILISGAGIAGPTLAFWLAHAGARVTIVERAPALRAIGQNVDLRGAGLEVIRRMGLEDIVRKNTTNEQGIIFVDANNRARAQFKVDQSGKDRGLTSSMKILRGTLAMLLYDSTKHKVEYIFGDYVSAVDETEDRIQVTFANYTPDRDFDLLIASDGLSSSTRSLIFPSTRKTCIRPLNQYLAYFSIPYRESDGLLARWYSAPGGRAVLMRPGGNAGRTMAVLSTISTTSQLQTTNKLSQWALKKIVRQLFEDAGWETSRVLDGMDNADDWYVQVNAQVKLESWSKGRMSVLGDAAYCPSPTSGMGTAVSLVGAYVLAGEISKYGADYGKAFREYENIMRPFVDKAQKLLPGAPKVVHPETAWGISVLYWILAFLSWSGLMKLVVSPPANAIVLPQYEM